MKEQTQLKYLTTESTDRQTLFVITHPLFSAKISEFGGQLLSYQPVNKQEMIWQSSTAVLDGSKPIRGGAPICWPWFGQAPESFSGEPQHGYARSVKWQITSVKETEELVEISLVPMFSEQLKQRLQLSLEVIYTFGLEAKIELVTTNLGTQDFDFSMAIHTYLNLADSREVAIPELFDCQYFDKLANKQDTQDKPFAVDQAMDRIYLYDKAELTVTSSDKKLNILQQGHDSVVVWNPWQQGAESMADFDDLGYLSMLCVEAALTQGYKLKPGDCHRISQTLID